MVDILVKPGSPKAWVKSLQTDLPSNCGFISSHSPASAFNLKSLTLNTILAEYPYDSTSTPRFKETSQSQASRFFRVHKPRAIPKRKKNSHRDIPPIMPHSSLSMGFQSPSRMSLFESRDSKDVKCVPTSPKPIHSSSAISSDIFGKGTTNSEIEYLPTKTIDERVLAKIDPDTTSSDSEPSIDMSWCCPSSSFISKNSDTSSLETSFGMMGTPDADISINSDLLFPSTSNTLSNTTLALEDSQPLSLHEDESLWPHRQSNGIDLWRQHFEETTSWESDYSYNWQNPELNLINSGLPSISWAQPYIHQTPLFNNPPGYIPHSTPHQSTIPSQKISNTALKIGRAHV